MQTKVNFRSGQIALICVMLFPLSAAAQTLTAHPVEDKGAPATTAAQPEGKGAPEQPKFDCPGADCSVAVPVSPVATNAKTGAGADLAGGAVGASLSAASIVGSGIGLLVIILLLF
jgi:hypothetical protein